MKLFIKFFIISIILLLSSNNLKAKDKVAYLDIDFILTNTIAGKSLLTGLQKQEEIKISKFRTTDEKFKNDEKKILAKKNLISTDEFEKEINHIRYKQQLNKDSTLRIVKRMENRKIIQNCSGQLSKIIKE